MNAKQQINSVIKKVQDEKKISRTDALHYLVKNYDISYTKLVDLAKWNRQPKQKRLWLVIEKIINDYGV